LHKKNAAKNPDTNPQRQKIPCHIPRFSFPVSDGKEKRYFLMAFASPKAIKTHYSEFSISLKLSAYKT